LQVVLRELWKLQYCGSFNAPVVDSIEQVHFFLKSKVYEHRNQVIVVRLLGEMEISHVLHKHSELVWAAGGQLFWRCFQFFKLDQFMLFGFSLILELPLPWEASFKKLDEHVTDGL
jgi:hypothetical protein